MKPCWIEGCENPKVPGRGKKLCAEHKATEADRRKPPAPCTIDGCSRPIRARGWCGAHYEHNRLYGTPHPRTMRDRFEEKLNRDGPEFGDLGRCWLWTGTGTKSGYGQMYDDAVKRHNYAHRISYELHVGPIPDGLEIDHLCRRTSCVNPDHLEPVTRLENQRRAAAAVTHCPRGHAYDEANTRVNDQGHRDCRACDRENWRRRQKENAA